MTNEEMAVLIQQGQQELMPELWEQTERFVRYMANIIIRELPKGVAVEFEDLYHSGYIALVKAVEYFDASKGSSFITIFSMTLKTAFAEAGGYRSDKQQNDPIHLAKSIYEPLPGYEDVTLGDTISDDNAEIDFENMEQRVFNEQLRSAISKAFKELTPQQQNVMRERYYEGKTLKSAAEALGVTVAEVRRDEGKAFRELRKPKHDLSKFIDELTSFYRYTGLSHFIHTGNSSVEEAVFYRERLAE